MLLFRSLVLLALSLNVSLLQAQIDTEFWFAAPEITQLHADRPIYLRISTMDQPATVTITQPANSLLFGVITVTIAANSTQTVNLTSRINYLENSTPDVVADKGLLIKSTALITAYYEVLGKSSFGVVNTDIFSLKGQNALGTKFYTPFQNHWDNITNPFVNAWSSFDIVAIEDGTIVTITPTQDIIGHAAGVPFTVTLNKGQTYSARALGTLAAEHLSGSLITSNKPIAVTIKDDSLYEAPNWDLAGDQLIPVSLTGLEYIAIKASLLTNVSAQADRAFICGTENATEIFINGSLTPAATIQAGETYMYKLDSLYNFIKTSKPAYVFHMTGFGKELAGALLPPIGCTGSRQVGFTRPTAEPFALNIVVRDGGEDDFKLNGIASYVPASAFDTVPGTGGLWKAAKIMFYDELIIATETPNILKNSSTDFHLGILNGDNSQGFRYGYFSDYGSLQLGADKAICKGDSVTFNGGFGMTSYDWNTGESSQYITVRDSGTYWVEIEKGSCILRDTIDSVHVAFHPDPRKVLGTDTIVCSNEGYVIKMDTLYTSYVWQNGSRDSILIPTTSGTYWVEVQNQFGCKESDSIDVVVHQAPQPVISFNQDLEKICWESTIVLDAGPGYSSYRWHSGESTQSITTPHLSEYYVVVTNANNCTDSTNLYIDCSPYVKVFNLFTPDGDGHNDVFFVEGLKPNKWILEIHNRWGDRVYYNRNYNNEFDGADLGGGIYYYTLRHVEDKKIFKGWVRILKGE